MDKATKRGVQILAIGFVVRVVGAGVTTLTTLNPDSMADAIGFANVAEAIALGLLEWHPYLIPPRSVGTVHLWGSFLAPFYLLPGPSGFYARLGNAFLGAFAIYNVYLIVRYYHSHQAGVVSSLPMIIYPSFVAEHSTLLREAMVLFGITTVVRLLVLPSQRRSRYHTYAITGVLLYVAYILRPENAIIYAAAIVAAVVTYAVEFGYVSKRSTAAAVVLSPVVLAFSLPTIRNGVEYLAQTRVLRASGRTVYLSSIVPRTIAEFFAFTWIGGAYFLYAPFPWMIETIPDLIVSLEGMVSIGFTVAAVWGVRCLGRKNTPVTVGLLVGLTVAVALYGVGTVNYGTAMRHRQMFLWVIFLFGGIGIAERFRFVGLPTQE